jgi:hypothetical protein
MSFSFNILIDDKCPELPGIHITIFIPNGLDATAKATATSND